MKLNKKKIIMILFVLLISVSFMEVQTFADVGDNVDYYDSGGSNNDGESGNAAIIWWIFYTVFSVLPWPMKIIVAVGIIAWLFIIRKSGRQSEMLKKIIGTKITQTVLNTSVTDNTNQIQSRIKEFDPKFSTPKFLGWTEEVFITLQSAWTTRDWEKIRPFEKEELFRKHQLQLQSYINSGTINVVERVNVNQTYLYKYQRDDEYEYMTVYLQSRLNDYVIDENTKAIVRGNREKEYHIKYLLTFMRKTGVLTDAATSNMSTKQCPHCGAPLAITSSGKCEYCDTIVTTGEFDWVLSDLDSVKNDTVLDGGGVFITVSNKE